MVGGPEMSHLIAGYETISCLKDAAITTKHHDQNASTQRTFVEKAEALQRVLKEMGKPFPRRDSRPTGSRYKDHCRSSSSGACCNTSRERKTTIQVIFGRPGE